MGPWVGLLGTWYKQSFVLREIEMPIAALSELHSAAAFFVERVTPFNGENACHVARLISKDRKSRLARVELAVMPRAHLQAVRSAVEECGGHLAGLSMDGDKGMPPLNFIPPNERTARSISSFSDLWKPILFAGIAVFAVGPSAVAYMIHLNAQRLANEAASIRSESASLLKYRSEFAARVAAAAFPLALQKGPYPIEVVDALTKAAPDDTWIFRLELVPGELRLAGFSKDVPRFLEHLSSKPFTAPELIAPVVHDASGRQSRFEIKVIVPEAP
jgi:general secretion pathway protein L